MATGASHVVDDRRLSVVEALHLEERGAAPRLVAGLRLPEHQALAAEGVDAIEFGAEIGLPGAAPVAVGARVGVLLAAEEFLEVGDPLFKGPAMGGSVKD